MLVAMAFRDGSPAAAASDANHCHRAASAYRRADGQRRLRHEGDDAAGHSTARAKMTPGGRARHHGLQAMASHRRQGSPLPHRGEDRLRRGEPVRHRSRASIRTPTASSSCSSGAIRSRPPTWSGSSSIRITIARTGYEFGVNAAGVKIDQAIDDDRQRTIPPGRRLGHANISHRPSAAWRARDIPDPCFRRCDTARPRRTVRHTLDGSHRRSTWYPERVSWPLLRQSKPGFVSQFGTVARPRRSRDPRQLEADAVPSHEKLQRIRQQRYHATVRTSPSAVT